MTLGWKVLFMFLLPALVIPRAERLRTVLLYKELFNRNNVFVLGQQAVDKSMRVR